MQRNKKRQFLTEQKYNIYKYIIQMLKVKII